MVLRVGVAAAATVPVTVVEIANSSPHVRPKLESIFKVRGPTNVNRCEALLSRNVCKRFGTYRAKQQGVVWCGEG